MPQIIITESETGRSLRAAIGDQLRIELSENPTTGFRWQIASFDANVVSLQLDTFLPSASGAVGSGGKHVFEWKTIGAGNTELRFELKRPWEALAPRSAFAIHVTVI